MNNKTSMFLGVLVGVFLSGAFVAGYRLMQPPRAAPTVTSTLPVTQLAATTEAEPPFVIKKAVYGDLPDGASVDVTEKVAATFDGTHVAILVSNENLGGDPAFGIAKTLRVEYTLRGKTAFRTATEGDTLVIRLNEKSVPLVILKAVYGDFPGGASSDVTQKVQEAFDGHSLSITASNDVFGDPAPGIPKRLRVLYTLDGTEKYKIVDEGETIKLPPDP